MFVKQQEAALANLSADLCDETDWRVGTLRTFNFPLNASTAAVEPLGGLIAVGKVDPNSFSESIFELVLQEQLTVLFTFLEGRASNPRYLFPNPSVCDSSTFRPQHTSSFALVREFRRKSGSQAEII